MAEACVFAKTCQENTDEKDSEMDESEEEEALFEVERIIGKSKIKGTVVYKVCWKGYGHSDDTWEPVANLGSCLDLIEEYDIKQAEMAKKKSDERKLRKMMMESSASLNPPDEMYDITCSNAQYPPNFKNTFWKELEAGRVDVFDNDMYSKVKEKRTCKQSAPSTSTSQSNYDDSPKNETLQKKKKRTQSNPELRLSTCTANSCSSPNESSNEQNVQVKAKTASKIKHTKSLSHEVDRKSTSSRKIEYNKISIVSESESDGEGAQSPILKVISNSLDTSNELERPALNIVIKKMPEVTSENDSTSYSVVKKQFAGGEKDGHKGLITKYSDDGIAQYLDAPNVCLDSHKSSSSSKKKKKKHHKHHKHKSDRKSDSREGSQHRDKHREADKKRKASTTSLSGLDGENTASRLKVPKLENESEQVKVPKQENEVKVPKVENKSVNVSKGITKDTQRNSQVIISTAEDNGSKVSQKFLASARTSAEYDKPSHSNSIITNTSSKTVSNFFSRLTPSRSSQLSGNTHSSDLIKQHLNRSQLSNSVVAGLSSQSTTSPNPLPLHNTLNKDSSTTPITTNLNRTLNSASNLTLNCSNIVPSTKGKSNSVSPESGVKHELDRQESETVDSGIASPASERSMVISRKEMMVQSFDDILGGSALPLLPDTDQTRARGGNQGLEIDLDDMDWDDLFDKDDKLEPVMLSNSEFARAAIDGNCDLLKMALLGDGKYDLEHPDVTGKTLLMFAAHKGHDDVADLLIEHGGNIDAKTNTGITALSMACEYAEICTVNLLLDRNAKVNVQCNSGDTPLMIAAKRGHNQILWLLLECGANFNLAAQSGHTALSYVRLLHYSDTEVILTSHISRVMSEFDRQVAITMNNTAKIISSLFPPQVYNICEAQSFKINFQHTMLPQPAGIGYLLFVGHAVFTSQEVKVRFYGPCAVKSLTLNGQPQSPLTEEGNFVLAFSPLVHGENVLSIHTVKAPEVKAKLIVCAYQAELLYL